MKIENLFYKNDQWIIQQDDNVLKTNVHLVTIFGDTDELSDPKHFNYFRNRYPNANIVGCSSSGNIQGEKISQNKIVATAVSFDNSTTVLKSKQCNTDEHKEELAYQLASEFDKKGLKHLFILADGLTINGSDVVKGFNRAVDIPKTGGLAGDGLRFEKTLVIANEPPQSEIMCAIGFYGENLTIGHGSVGGWSELGAQRLITKSDGNTLYELDGEPVLDYYKRYLSGFTDNLQDISLRFPFGIKENENDISVIRTALKINEKEGSITVSGDIPQGYIAQLMKPEIDLLIEGAGEAAKIAKVSSSTKRALALTVSCAGRKGIMSQLIDDEIEEVTQELGKNANLIGFYSYGEIAPFQDDINSCKLHNQTMTLTVIYEDNA